MPAPFLAATAVLAGAVLVAACGGGSGSAAADATESADASLACVMSSGGETSCVEFAGFESPDKRMAAGAGCRSQGGRVETACPAEGLLGRCEVDTDATRADVYSRQRRDAVYAGLRADAQREACTQMPGARWLPAG
jgi:hypothetical protein